MKTLIDILEYARFFFLDPNGAPVRKWYTFPASCRRVLQSLKVTREIQAGCSDVFEWGQKRSELLQEALENLKDNHNS